ncbi:lipopolysaccharide biosynthesis protein [Allofournierella massiliensis]|uniref:lipopolysaccharide biosynthesis protein n=1 Tax=Allofournierella massiliensis TaxID=1650663 RepID=UPI0024B263FF|nr:hypothetical protein [Fournierella massiliensis]
MINNITYTLFSNIISFLISAVITFVVPKQLGSESYGYFQLYLFYVNYTGFLHFGWADGVFLRYGGQYYEKLDKPKFSGQFWLYSGVEVAFGLLICLAGYTVASPQDKAIVLALTGISVFLLLPRTLLQYVLQGTNRIKEYATLTVLEKIVYVTVVVLFLLAGTHSFIPMILADLLGKSCALLYSIYQCRDILTTKPVGLQASLKEAWANISVGIKLMFANIASMLIIGFVRLSIENQWDVTTFGKVSLTMSVSNLLMVFINAVAMVMFPMLRRTNSDELSGIYNTMRTYLMIPLLGMLVCYYPAKVILSAWLPQYADSLVYMALLFPMCVFESKMSMLINTYLKTLRKEKWLLLVNVVTVSLSVVITLITTYWLHNLDLAVASIVFLLAFRCVFAELLLSTVLDVNVKTDIILEIALTIIFIGASWFVGGLMGLAIYAVAYLIYLFIKRNDVAFVLAIMLNMFRRRNA